MATAMGTNHRARPSLGEQIDRLEGVVDALAIGLNEAVAMIVERVVGEAVRKAVSEVLASPEVKKHLAVASVPGIASSRLARPRHWTRCAVRAMGRLAWRGVVGLSAWGRSLLGRSQETGRDLWSSCRLLGFVTWRLRRLLLTSMAVGLVVGIACYFAGATTASVVGGMCAATAILFATGIDPLWQAILLGALEHQSPRTE